MEKKKKTKKVKEELKVKINDGVNDLTKSFFDVIKNNATLAIQTDVDDGIFVYGLRNDGNVVLIKLNIPEDNAEKIKLYVDVGKKLWDDSNNIVAFGLTSHSNMKFKEGKEDKSNEVLLVEVVDCFDYATSKVFSVNRLTGGGVLGFSDSDKFLSPINSIGWRKVSSDIGNLSSIIENVVKSYISNIKL